MTDQLYFRQLLSGRDFAVDDQMAQQMVNFVYLIGDRESRECVIVDPAYSVRELLDVAAADDMNVVGALATHYHPDHIGGKMMGFQLEGIAELLALQGMKIHVQEAEAAFVRKVTGISESDIAAHDPGDVVEVGNVKIHLVHTPGHTPGSQCFLVDGRLVSGDTLFLEGCGRTDLPGSNPEDMYDSLARLAQLPDDTVVYPGHRYSLPSSGSMETIRTSNYVYRPKTREQWLMMFAE